MPRQKKNCQPISIRMDSDTFNRLAAYCELVGQAKTVAIERAINMYIDDFESKQAIIQKNRENGQE